jgi:mono/diheme cytochrome c family protein
MGFGPGAFSGSRIQETFAMKLNVIIVAAALGAAGFVSPVMAQDAPYKVADGNKVDAKTLNGWRIWRAMACERCHGPNQEGMVGPSLIDALKKLSKEEFQTTIMKGRIDKGMPNFDGAQQVVNGWEDLYGYLKGRSDGAIKPGRVQPMEGG